MTDTAKHIEWQEVYNLDDLPEGDEKQQVIDALEIIENSDTGQILFKLYLQRQAIDKYLPPKAQVTFEGNIIEEAIRKAQGGERRDSSVFISTFDTIHLHLKPKQEDTYYFGTKRGDITGRQIPDDEIIFHESAHLLFNHLPYRSLLYTMNSLPGTFENNNPELALRKLQEQDPNNPEIAEHIERTGEIFEILRSKDETRITREFLTETESYLQQLSDNYLKLFYTKYPELKDEAVYDKASDEAFARGEIYINAEEEVYGQLAVLLTSTRESLNVVTFREMYDFGALNREVAMQTEDFAMDFTNRYRSEKSDQIIHRQHHMTNSRNFTLDDESDIAKLNQAWLEKYASHASDIQHIRGLIKQFNFDDKTFYGEITDDELDYIKSIAKEFKDLDIKVKKDGDTRDLVIKGTSPSTGKRTKDVINDIDSIRY